MAVQLVTSAEMKSQCGKKITKKFSWLQNPGAGMHLDSIKPFDKDLKDGYVLIGRVKNPMYVLCDKFGNNKFDCKVEKHLIVSSHARHDSLCDSGLGSFPMMSV